MGVSPEKLPTPRFHSLIMRLQYLSQITQLSKHVSHHIQSNETSILVSYVFPILLLFQWDFDTRLISIQCYDIVLTIKRYHVTYLFCFFHSMHFFPGYGMDTVVCFCNFSLCLKKFQFSNDLPLVIDCFDLSLVYYNLNWVNKNPGVLSTVTT